VPQLSADLDTVDVRQAEVQQHEIERRLRRLGEPLLPEPLPRHLMTADTETRGQNLSDCRVVLNEEQVACHGDILASGIVIALYQNH
jgi:hypothetical protein